jgi:hypothetical protein
MLLQYQGEIATQAQYPMPASRLRRRSRVWRRAALSGYKKVRAASGAGYNRVGCGVSTDDAD